MGGKGSTSAPWRRVASLKRSALFVGLFAGLGTLGILGSTLGTRTLSPGPLSRGHAALEECESCHTIPFRDIRALTGTSPHFAMNAACLNCHSNNVAFDRVELLPLHGSSRAAAEGTACAECHFEHESADDLQRVQNAACVGCHAEQEHPVTRFASPAKGGDHPQFAVPVGDDTGALRFDHSLHLQGGATTCSDCHVSESKGAAHERSAYMKTSSFADACARCHPLTVELAGARVSVGHAALAEAREELALKAERRGVPAAQLDRARASLTAEGGPCQTCHPITASDDGLQRIEPPALRERWYQEARFDHGRHSSISWLGPHRRQDGECLVCHVSAPTSASAEDVLIPSADACLHCHGEDATLTLDQPEKSLSRCSACHTFHEPITHEVLIDVDAQTLAHGLDQTRFGARRGTSYWPVSMLAKLPEFWGKPEIEPQSPEFWDEMFARYGFFEAPYENGGLPLGMTLTEELKFGEPAFTVDCEVCHSTMLFGELVVGQPNRFPDLERAYADFATFTGDNPTDPLYMKNPPRNTVVNGADQLGLLGLLFHQSDLAVDVKMGAHIKTKTAMRYKSMFDELAFVKTPPWYLFRTKLSGTAGFYYDGGHPKDGNFAAFTYVAGFHELDGANLRAALSDWKRGGPAWLASLKAPLYPFPIDASVLPLGRRLYDEKCAECHGHYEGPDATPASLTYPGRVIPIEEVNTDPKRARFPVSFVTEMRRVLHDDYTPNPGYVATPLTGIWARGPYLHNGSVPTLRTLLDPPTRPERWALLHNPNNAEDYLQEDVGWRFAPVSEDEVTRYPRVHDPGVVDGLTNGGHTYGAELSPAERSALIEFLKTL